MHPSNSYDALCNGCYVEHDVSEEDPTNFQMFIGALLRLSWEDPPNEFASTQATKAAEMLGVRASAVGLRGQAGVPWMLTANRLWNFLSGSSLLLCEQCEVSSLSWRSGLMASGNCAYEAVSDANVIRVEPCCVLEVCLSCVKDRAHEPVTVVKKIRTVRQAFLAAV